MTTVRKILGGKESRVLTIEKDATVLQAIERMAEHKVGSLVVMDSDDDRTHVAVRCRISDELPSGSIFGSIQEASEFSKQSRNRRLRFYETIALATRRRQKTGHSTAWNYGRSTGK